MLQECGCSLGFLRCSGVTVAIALTVLQSEGIFVLLGVFITVLVS